MQRLQEQQQLFKSDVPTPNYQLSVSQNSAQLFAAGNTSAYSVASLQSSISRGYQVFNT